MISDRSYNHLSKIESVKLNKLMRLNLSFNLSIFPQPNSYEVDRIEMINKNKKIILTIGRLIPVENHLFLLDVIKNIKGGLSFVLLILVEGTEFDKLNEKIEQENLQDKVQLLGYKNNVFDYLIEAVVLLHFGITGKSGIITAKIFEYLTVQKNILIISKENDVMEKLVKRTRTGEIARSAEDLLQIGN